MARFKTYVVIDEKSLERWNVLRSESDARIIADKADVTQQTVYNAFNTGKCQPALFDIMAAYYEEKYQAFVERLSDYND